MTDSELERSQANPRFEVAPMEYEDLEQVIEIENQSFPTPWTPDIFINEFMNPRSRRLVVLDRSVKHWRKVVGYMIYWEVTCDEFHLMSIAVHPKYRRRGVASALLRVLVDNVRKCRGRVVLEVRVSNLAAQQLYSKFGFRPIGLRRRYYLDTGEDALLMELDFADEAETPKD